APATAAQRAGVAPPTVTRLAERIEGLADRDLVVVEGAGGGLVRFDEARRAIAGLASLLGAPAIGVTRARLRTLHHTALTCEALHARGVRCLGVVIGALPARPDLAAQCNLDDLVPYAGVPLLGRLPEGAGRLTADAFAKLAASALGQIADL